MLFIEHSDSKIVVKTDQERVVALYVSGCHAGRPYFHPLAHPDGPILTDFRPEDHPHHCGLWIGHHQVVVGGTVYDFYFEGPRSGRIVDGKVRIIQQRGSVVEFEVDHVWHAHDGQIPLRDRWLCKFGLYDNCDVWMDFGVILTTDESCVTLRSTNECALPMVRVASAIAVRNGGSIRNSRGDEKEWLTFGRRAEWVDYSGRIGKWGSYGIAIFDNPNNKGFPCPWFTRDYGPFGPGRNYFDGDIVITPTVPMVFQYRIVVHRGDANDAKIKERWMEYILSATLLRSGVK